MAGTLTVQNIEGPSSGANANKVIIPSTNSLYAPNHVVQVLTQEITAYTTLNSSTSLTATGFTLTITPKSTASKIKCTVGINGFYTAALSTGASFQLYKGGSLLAWLDNIVGYSHPSGQIHQNSNPTMMHVDSPSTTSATTYAIFWARVGGSGNIHFNNYLGANNQTRSWFTVEEIAQ